MINKLNKLSKLNDMNMIIELIMLEKHIDCTKLNVETKLSKYNKHSGPYILNKQIKINSENEITIENATQVLFVVHDSTMQHTLDTVRTLILMNRTCNQMYLNTFNV